MLGPLPAALSFVDTPLERASAIVRAVTLVAWVGLIAFLIGFGYRLYHGERFHWKRQIRSAEDLPDWGHWSDNGD